MTDAAAPTYRPSPRPHPAAAPSRPTDTHLHVVPTLQPETETAENTPTETITAGQSGSSLARRAREAAAGFRVRIDATRAYWTPPAVFTDRPASLAELAEYAREAPWTQQKTGPIRAVGVSWYRFVGYPKTVKNRYSEWIWQRPFRAFAFLGAVKIFALTGPGSWAVDHIVYPAAHLAGHLFL